MICLDADRKTSVVQVSGLEAWACLWCASFQALVVVLGARSEVSGVLHQVMFQMNGFRLHGSSPVPASHSLSQTGGVAFPVYVRLSKHEMLGSGTLVWLQLVTLIYP